MKTVNIIISAVVFTALALGLAGTGKLVIGVALVLQAVQFVWLWAGMVEDDGADIPTSTTTPPVEQDNTNKEMDQIKTIDEP